MSDIFPKSKRQIGEQDFKRLFNLCYKFSWLEKRMSELYYLWTETDNDFQKVLIEELLRKFLYLDEALYSEKCTMIAEEISNKLKLSGANSLIVATCEGQQPDGSQLVIQNLKNKFNPKEWEEDKFLTQIEYLKDKLRDNLNIVLVDDFVGTAKTIEGKVKSLKQTVLESNFKNVRIFFMAVAAMEFSKSRLRQLGITYFSSSWLKKGISENFRGSSLTQAKFEMKNMEKKLAEKWDQLTLPSFGYEESESLFSNGSVNVPNNVFPVFWWPYDHNNNERNTLFKRVSQRRRK